MPHEMTTPMATEAMAAEEQFRLVVEAAPNGMVMVDGAGRIVLVNSQIEKMFGYDREALIGQPVEILVPQRFQAKHPDYRRGFFTEPKTRAMGGGRDLFGLRKDGSEIAVEIGLTPLVTAKDTFVLASVVDITERKRAEEALRESEERFRTLVSQVKDYAIVMLDPTGHIASWNEGAERIKGYRADEIIGQHFSRFYLNEDIAAGKPEMELEVARREGRFEDDGWRMRKDGSRFFANVVLTTLKDQTGKLRGFAKITRDLTEQRRQQEAILELSTPVLQLREGLLILPIIGVLDSRRAQQLTEQLLKAIRSNRGRVTVLDITGVPVVDSKIANHLIQTIDAARLMGSLTILSGLSPDIARTLVTIGVDLSKVRTVSDLQTGIEEGERLLGYKVTRVKEAQVGALVSEEGP